MKSNYVETLSMKSITDGIDTAEEWITKPGGEKIKELCRESA